MRIVTTRTIGAYRIRQIVLAKLRLDLLLATVLSASRMACATVADATTVATARMIAAIVVMWHWKIKDNVLGRLLCVSLFRRS